MFNTHHLPLKFKCHKDCVWSWLFDKHMTSKWYDSISMVYDFKEMWDKKILAADRLVDPLCQQSTEEHMHPCCGPIYNRLLVMVHIYFAHRYILLKNIFCS